MRGQRGEGEHRKEASFSVYNILYYILSVYIILYSQCIYYIIFSVYILYYILSVYITRT